MKNILSFAATLGLVGLLGATTIDWELPNLTDGSTDANAIEVGIDDIVFILQDANAMSYDSSSGIITVTDSTQVNSGSNTLIDTDPLQGTWTDSNTAGGTYYMAYKSGSTYYAISDGSDGVMTVVTTADSGNDPLTPGGAVNGTATFSDSVWESGTIKTIATSVPEPATAALALAGIAMLVSRRRVA